MTKARLSLLASAGVAAVGASFGRDLYKLAKRRVGLLILLLIASAVLYLPYKGLKIITGSGPYFSWRWTFRAALPGGLMAAGGFMILNVLFLVASDSLSSERIVGTWHPGVVAIASASALAVLLMLIGAVRGFLAKRRTDTADAILVHNQQFLEALGFSDAAGLDASYLDGDANPLRLVSSDKTRLTFIATGRRKQRAYIALDKDGRMTSYSGIVSI